MVLTQSCQVFCSEMGFTYPQRKVNCNPSKCLVSSSSFMKGRQWIVLLLGCLCCYCRNYTYCHCMVWRFTYVRREVEKGNHNSGNSLIHSWHWRVSQGFLVGKTNGRILRFLMQRSKSVYGKAFPSYVFFPLDRASGKGKVQFLLHILCFSSLRFPTENNISLFKPLGEKNGLII